MDGDQDIEERRQIAKWDDISFSCNEETVTGTLGVFSTDCMYHVRTQATINPAGKVEETPSVRAIVNHDEILIAIDNTLHIFNENCCELKSSLNTKSIIDCFAASEDGNFILLGQSNGTINLIYVPLALTILSHTLVNVDDERPCFCGIGFSFRKDKGYYDAVICGYDNIIFKVSKINLEQISVAIQQNDMEKASHCRDQIKLSNLIDENEPEFSVKSCHFFADRYNFSSLITVGEGSIVLKMWAIDNESCTNSVQGDIFDCSSINKTQMSRNNAHIIVLDGKNTLHVLCSSSLILLKTWAGISVSDFVYWESAESKNVDNKVNYDSKLLVLSMPNDGHCYLNVYNFLSFELIYTTKMSPFVWLVTAPSIQDNVMIIEGVLNVEHSEVSEVKSFSCLKIKSIEEMVPETRLSRLLKKKKFEEAVSFGSTFGLDLQIVYWTRLNCLSEDLLAEKYHALSRDALDEVEAELFLIVNKLQNLEQLVEYCQVIEMPSMDLFMKLILHIKKRLKENTGTEKQLTILNKLLQRLFTFNYIFGPQNFSLKWNEFKHRNMFDTFLDLMESKNISMAVCLWLRHECEIIELANIKRLLPVIPNNIHYSDNAKWFYNDFLHKFIKSRPDYLEPFCAWLINYSKCLEFSEKNEWPNNAFQFAKNIYETVNSVVSSAEEFSSPFCAKPSTVQSCLNQLEKLVIALEDLELLHRRYKCEVRYVDFVQEDSIAICCELLNGIHDSEIIPDFVTEFLKSYSKRNNLDVDYILVQYIMDMLSRVSQSNLCWDDTDVEERIIIIAQNISSDEFKCKAVLEFISTAPWCESMDCLINQILNLNHPLVDEIREQICFVEIKKILRKYNISDLSLLQGKISERVFKYIVAQDKSSSLNDALKVSQIYHHHFNAVDIYNFRLKFLISQDREEEFRKLVKELPPEYSVQSCKRFVNFVCNLLIVNNDCRDIRNLCEERLFTKSALYVLRHLATIIESFKFDEFLRIQNQLERIYLIQTEYGLHLTLLDLSEVGVCEVVFVNYVTRLMNENHSDQNCTEQQIPSLATKISHTYRLGNLLNFSKEKCLGLFTRRLIDDEDFLTLTKVLSKFAEDVDYADASYFLKEISLTLHQLIQKTLTPSPSSEFLLPFLLFLHKLISALLVNCEAELIIDCLMATKWTATVLLLTEKERINSDLYRGFGQFDYQELTLINGADVANLILQIVARNLKLRTEKCDSLIMNIGRKVCTILRDKGSLIQSLQLISELIANFNYCASIHSSEKAEFETFLECIAFRQNLTSTLLVNVLSSERIDTQLAVTLSLNLPKHTTEKVLKDIISSVYDCPNTFLTNLGCILANMWADLELSMTFSNWHKHVTWVKKFTELQISTNVVIETASNNEWKQYLTDFTVHPDVNVNLLEKFCHDFNIKLDDALLLYIEHQVKILPLKDNDKEHLATSPKTFANNMALQPLFYNDFTYCAETEAINERIDEAILMVQNKVHLIGKLSDFLNKISPYNYEAISIVLHHILKLASVEKPATVDSVWRKLKLLDFLNDYHRVQQPSENEIGAKKTESRVWCRRLPFHSFYSGNPWKIISTELNSETATLWQRIVPLLQLSSFDDVLSCAVNNEVNQFNKTNKHKDLGNDFHLRSMGDSKLEKIFDLIDRVSDPTVTMCCIVWVVSNLPMGPDKVSAAKKSAELATKFINDHTTQLVSSANIQTTKDFIKRCKRQLTNYLEIATEVVLLRHNLKTTETEKLIDKPEKLIVYLLDRHCLNNDGSTDMFKVSEEIAQINNINFEDIHVTLVEKWLTPADLNVQKLHENPTLEDEKLHRAVYVLKHLPLEETILFLLNKIWQESYLHNYAFKHRVLKCLSLIADNCQIREYSRNTITDVWEHLRLFQFLSRFEKLRLSMNLAMFQDCDKENLVQTIWKKTALNAEVISLVVNLCIYYKIKNINLWEEILEQMINRKMITEIKKFLSTTLDFCELWETDSYTNAWIFVVLDIMQSEPGNGEDKLLQCLQAVEILFRCPTPLSDCSQTVITELFKMGYPALGFGCILQMSDYCQSAVILESHSNPTSMRLTRDNLLFFKENNLCFPQSKQVTQFFLNYVQLSGLFDLILDTDYYNDFILILLGQNDIKELLLHFKRVERWQDCADLIEQFISKYPDSPAAICADLKDRTLVETFINATAS